jgi:hypothetical protein
MGNVKDRYFKYAEAGDQYVGRCLALLPILQVELAISPPFFGERSDLSWVGTMVISQFCALRSITEYGLMLRQCLASLLFHRKWVNQFLSFNHVVITSSVCFRDQDDLIRVEEQKWIKTSYPWSDPDHKFSGIPPYCALLQHIAEVRSEQRVMCMSFIDRVKTALTEYGVNAGSLSEERVSAILNEFYGRFEEQLSRYVCNNFFLKISLN